MLLCRQMYKSPLLMLADLTKCPMQVHILYMGRATLGGRMPDNGSSQQQLDIVRISRLIGYGR